MVWILPNMFLRSNSNILLLITGAILLFLFTMLGAYRLTQFSDQLLTPEFLVTPDAANYSPEKAFDQIQQHPEKITDGFFNAGFTQYRWWVLINISPTEKSWLQIANPHINDLRIYEEENGKWKQSYIVGDYYPYAKRIFDDPDYWIPIEPKQQRILMRVDKKGESLNIPLRMIRDIALAPYLANRNFFHGIFLGWIVLLLMLNLFLWISLKDPIHFFYILYVSFSVLWIVSQWGIGFRYFWPEWTEFTAKARPFFSNVSYIFLLELTARFFTIQNKQPLYRRAIRIFQLLMVISSFGLLVTDYANSSTIMRYVFLTSMNIIWIGALVLIILFIWKSYAKQKTLALFFLSALGFFGVYILLLLLSQYNLGGNWMFFANMYGSPVGFLGESTILSFGLSQRYNLYKKEKDQAMQALEKEKREVADKMIQTQEEERNRLARELHDGLGGLLGSIRIGADHRLKSDPQTQHWIGEQLDMAVTDLRNIAHDLMPVQLQEQGLDRILEKTVARWNSGEGYKIRYTSQLKNRYPLRTEAALYRIVLELLHNIKKHAEASEVTIEIWEDEKMNRLTLLVEDNGKGFDISKEEGIGWKSIRQRVQYMNGKINLDSSHHGSTVIIDVSMEIEKR
ncbi:MAG: hypothetical protein IBJ16_01075 [Chitinophagaceae bacterium]|nr:hypothetical protein [Chitinophagaceae bacterium]